MKKNRKDQFDRNNLSDVVPLETPYKINIDVASACNFKCKFCFHALDDAMLKSSGFKPRIMDYRLFENIIEQISQFPEKVKCIGLTGIGEPLLNKRLPDMIKLTKDRDVADKVVVTTNASLLHPKLSEALVNAGLDELIISVESMTDEGYQSITGAKVNFEQLLNNIRYLYKHRKECLVFAKIVDMAFDSDNDQRDFHVLFDGISDMAYVERIIPQFKPVDYEPMNLNYKETIYGKEAMPINVCSMIFYAMQIAANGNVCPCCVDYNETVVFGNIEKKDLYNIWNSSRFNEFRKQHLLGRRREIELCHDCRYFIYNIRDEDILDNNSKMILEKMKKG